MAKRSMLLFPLAAALAACSGNHDATPSATTGKAEPAAATASKPLPAALPQNFQLHFPYSFKEETIVRVSPRDQRRRITVDYLEDSAGKVLASLDASAVEAGFRSGRWQLRADGSIYYFAHKPGYGQLRAEIRSNGRDSAGGTVVMGWPVRTTPAAAPSVP